MKYIRNVMHNGWLLSLILDIHVLCHLSVLCMVLTVWTGHVCKDYAYRMSEFKMPAR